MQNSTVKTHEGQVIKLLSELARNHGLRQVFADFVEIAAIALSRLDTTNAPRREEQFTKVMMKYSGTERAVLVSAFGELVLSFEARFSVHPAIASDQTRYSIQFDDVLGRLFMSLDMGNTRSGQFFTPFSVSQLLARMNATDRTRIDEVGFVRVCEPACGSGGMVIALADAYSSMGLNYQRCMHATAYDIDARCIHMAFVQLSLLHIPAVLVHGNTLSGERWDVWVTPAHILGRWNNRLNQGLQQAGTGGEKVELRLDAELAAPRLDKNGVPQLSLF